MNTAYWKRIGSECEAVDRSAGHPAHGEETGAGELTDMLADHFAEDLGKLDKNDYETALDALVDGYRHGG